MSSSADALSFAVEPYADSPRALLAVGKEPYQLRGEEGANALTHGIAALAAVGATALLLRPLIAVGGWTGGAFHNHHDAPHTRHFVAALAVYGLSLIAVYLCSTCYHGCRDHAWKERLRLADHAAIYALIAGTYTPLLMVLVGGHGAYRMCTFLWATALAGTLAKAILGPRLHWLTLSTYLVMGWICLIDMHPILQAIPAGCMVWIVLGGLAYTAGVVFYLWGSLPFNHTIWHLFVIAGSAFHFIAVLHYVVPAILNGAA